MDGRKKAIGLTKKALQEIAEKVGCGISTIYRWRRGNRSVYETAIIAELNLLS